MVVKTTGVELRLGSVRVVVTEGAVEAPWRGAGGRIGRV